VYVSAVLDVYELVHTVYEPPELRFHTVFALRE